jgi:hypothetical protein
VKVNVADVWLVGLPGFWAMAAVGGVVSTAHARLASVLTFPAASVDRTLNECGPSPNGPGSVWVPLVPDPQPVNAAPSTEHSKSPASSAEKPNWAFVGWWVGSSGPVSALTFGGVRSTFHW